MSYVRSRHQSPLLPLTLSRRHDIGRGFKSLAENLVKFNELGKLPKGLQLNRIDEGQGVEAALIDNDTKWHHTFILNYNNTMLQRAENRKEVTPMNITSNELPTKRNRQRSFSTSAFPSEASCFFCGQSAVQIFFTRHQHIRLRGKQGQKKTLRRHLLCKDLRQHMLLWSSMSRELFIRVVMSGVKLLSIACTSFSKQLGLVQD